MSNRFVSKLKSLVALSAEETAALTRATKLSRKYPPRRDLIREGDPPGPVFVMLEGWACRYKILPAGTRQITAFLMPGDACDLHLGLLREMDHSIQTLTPARVATIPRGEMARLMSEHGGIAKAMYIAQLVDEATLRSWIVSMGRRSSLERVAHLVCELYLRSRGNDVGTSDRFALPLSQIALADALGMTPVHINRVLRELRVQGAMAIERSNLIIIDPIKLVTLAGFDENYLHRRLRTIGWSGAPEAPKKPLNS